jgi:hypothetical protein
MGRQALRGEAGSGGVDLLSSLKVGIFPPEKRLRPFSEDYRQGRELGDYADDTGKLTRTIDGDPIRAKYVAGRRVQGGADEALSPDELVALAKEFTGKEPVEIARSQIPRRSSGAFVRGDDSVAPFSLA